MLPCCVDGETGKVDREKEQYYWGKTREAQKQLDELKARPRADQNLTTMDFTRVKDFLKVTYPIVYY